MKRLPCVLILTLFTCFNAHARYEYLLHKTYAQRYQLVDSLFYYTPFLEGDSSILKQANEIAQLAKKNDDEELLMETVLIRATYYTSGRQKNTKAVEPLLLDIIEKAHERGDKPMELRARQFLARFYIEEQNKYGPALDQLVRSYYLIKDLSIEEFPNKKAHVYNIAAAYYNYGDYDNAKKYLLEADKLAMPPTQRKYEMAILMNIQNTLGLLHRTNKDYDSAEYYFRTAHAIAKKEHDTTWMGIADGNIGISYFLQKKYERAIPLLEEDVYMSFKAYEYDNAVNSLLKLAEIRVLNGDIVKAEQEMQQVKDSLYRTRDPFKHKLGLFQLLARLYQKKGNVARAYLYADSALIIKDSMTARLNAIALARNEQKIAAERYNADLAKADAEKKLQLFIRNGLLIVIILLGVIGLLIFNRMRLKHARERERLASQNKFAQLELDTATKQLDNFTQNIQEKNELIEKFTIEIEKLKQLTVNNIKAQELNNDILSELQQSTILTEDQWEEFRYMFEQVHMGYIDRMKEKYPALSPADTRFMVLTKLKFSNKEMEGVLGVGSEAIRQYRYRVRKKLSLPDEINLQEIAQMI